jgi:hypothetical protein
MLLTHAETRYRHFLFPILIPYAAWMLAQSRRPAGPNARGDISDRHDAAPARAPLANVEQVFSIALLWTLIGAVWLIYYPREWAAQNLARGWHAQVARIAWAAGSGGAALRADERAIAAHETPDGWIQLGDHARGLGDTDRALQAYRNAVGRAPPYVASVARLGDLLRANGQAEAARAAFVGDYVDQQRLADWSWRELRPAGASYLDVGDGLDFGYVGGVYPAEQQQGAPTRRTKGRGFIRLEADRTEANRATLLLRLAAPRPDGATARAEVCVAGSCQPLSVGPAWRTYWVPLDAQAGGPLTIEIRSDTFTASDGRRLGVLIDWAWVR